MGMSLVCTGIKWSPAWATWTLPPRDMRNRGQVRGRASEGEIQRRLHGGGGLRARTQRQDSATWTEAGRADQAGSLCRQRWRGGNGVPLSLQSFPCRNMECSDGLFQGTPQVRPPKTGR